jgi:hypothetical protein
MKHNALALLGEYAKTPGSDSDDRLVHYLLKTVNETAELSEVQRRSLVWSLTITSSSGFTTDNEKDLFRGLALATWINSCH